MLGGIFSEMGQGMPRMAGLGSRIAGRSSGAFQAAMGVSDQIIGTGANIGRNMRQHPKMWAGGVGGGYGAYRYASGRRGLRGRSSGSGMF